MFETEPSELAARRIARIVFGGVLIAGAIALVLRRNLPFAVSAAELVIGSWTLAFGLAWIVGRSRVREPRGSLFKASFVVPSVGVALMLPLLIHLPFVIVAEGVTAYDTWVGLSIYVVGTAHIAFALTAAIRASQLVKGVRPLSTGTVLAIVVGVSCIPFALFLMIPPLLVAATSLPILPLFAYQARLVERERHAEASHLPRAIAWTA